MHSARKTVFSFLVITLSTLCTFAANYEFTDEEPEVTDRVARISAIKGDVSIRRSGVDEWEKAALNLPVVEGDEITTSDGSRFEIQFDANTHLRVSENSYLKIATLSDAGIALSLPEGSLSISALKFDPSKKYFEIDAPKTTLAVQRSGRYRVDAGKAGSQEIRISVFDDGEARVYSSNSGFTIRDGRSARIFVEGNLAGEWENGYATANADDFDVWVAERIDTISKRLSNANYGQYYDDDIFGAEDLSDNGDWIHTQDYGYIWRPNRTSTMSYSDWSPYRYGHWRWLPAFGWTWVNDEPWGWATYHHGRWIWYNMAWYWSPYSYQRTNRSWWYPALVVIRVIDGNVCWYPLSYRRRYYSYHRPYHGGNNRPTVGPTPRPTPRLDVYDPPTDKGEDKPDVPDTGIIAVPLDAFGTKRLPTSRVSPQIAIRVRAGDTKNQEEPIRLPTMNEIKTKVNRDIRAEAPPIAVIRKDANTGAEKRDKGVPLDDRLRNKIIYGNRPATQPVKVPDDSQRKIIPATGAIARPEVKSSEPTETQPVRVRPRREPPPQTDTPVRTAPPRSEPTKRPDPPPRDNEPVRTAPPRSEPTKRSDPPATKSEPTKRSDTSKPSSDEKGKKP